MPALPLPQRTALAVSLDLDPGSFSSAYSQLLAAGNQRLGLLQGFLQVGASSDLLLRVLVICDLHCASNCHPEPASAMHDRSWKNM